MRAPARDMRYGPPVMDDSHILVVEDDARLRDRLARYLTGEGFRVTAAPDAAEFEAGADDYLPKPFEPRELVLRIRALLRRAPSQPAPTPEPAAPVRIGTAIFDLGRGELTGPNGPIRLTGGEAALLTALATRPGAILSREDIAATLGTDDAGERAVDVQVTRLRRKIEADPREPRFLHTVRGRGYVLKPGV
jgi:two-component system, OmpR family, phosphate regulon response regulator OmpR